MAERRKLTDQERASARNFAQALDASAYIPESLAGALGVTPGAVGHWYRGEIVIPLRRVAKTAQLLGVAPELISAEWAESITPHLPPSGLTEREARLIQNFRAAGASEQDSIERVAAAMAAPLPGVEEAPRKAG